MLANDELTKVKEAILRDRGYLKPGETLKQKAEWIASKLKEFDEMREAALHASIDLDQDTKFQQDRNAVIDEATKLDLLDVVSGHMTQDIKKNLAAMQESVGKAQSFPMGKIFKKVDYDKIDLELLVAGLKTLASRFKDYFQLSDLFEIVQNCVNGESDLATAIEIVAESKKRKAFLIVDLFEEDEYGNAKIHGCFLNEELALHYFNQLPNEVMMVPTVIADRKTPIEMQMWEIDWRYGSAKKTKKFWTFDHEAFTVFPVKYKHAQLNERFTMTEIENCKAITPASDTKSVPDLAIQGRREHKKKKLKLVKDLGNQNFYIVIPDPDAET